MLTPTIINKEKTEAILPSTFQGEVKNLSKYQESDE